MTEIKLYGADWCPDCRRAKSYLKENNVNYSFIDVDLDKDATSRVEAINNGKRIIPTIIINDTPYTNPENATLASILGINEAGKVRNRKSKFNYLITLSDAPLLAAGSVTLFNFHSR